MPEDSLNAAHVGMLPWPRWARFIMVSEGALRGFLPDYLAVRGMLASRIATARLNIPLWSLPLLLIPLFCVDPLRVLGIEDLGAMALTATALAVLMIAFLIAQWIARRVLIESDVLADEWTDGVLPILERFRMQGLSPSGIKLLLGPYPSIAERMRTVREVADDPRRAASFRARSTAWRVAILSALVASIGFGAWGQWKLWPVDAVSLALHTGRFDAAADRLSRLDPAQVPAVQRPVFDRLGPSLEAGMRLAPDGVEDWRAFRERAEREVESLLRSSADVGAATHTLVWALGKGADPWLGVLYRGCLARLDGDRAEVDEAVQCLSDMGRQAAADWLR